MKTQKVKIDGKEQEVINTSYAWAYALKKELEAITGSEINEDKFYSFLDQEFCQISDALQEAWENWNED